MEAIHLNGLPRGYKFYPSDVDLIDYYLKQKIARDPQVSMRIPDVDVYMHSPQELARYKFEGEKEAYVFTPRTKKYANGKRPDRSAGDHGFWKASGREIPIIKNNIEIGFKRNLVFYKGKPRNASKTNWIMQEYTLSNTDDWALCKIYEHNRGKKFESENIVNQQVTNSTNQDDEAQQMDVDWSELLNLLNYDDLENFDFNLYEVESN